MAIAYQEKGRTRLDSCWRIARARARICTATARLPSPDGWEGARGTGRVAGGRGAHPLASSTRQRGRRL